MWEDEDDIRQHTKRTDPDEITFQQIMNKTEKTVKPLLRSIVETKYERKIRWKREREERQENPSPATQPSPLAQDWLWLKEGLWGLRFLIACCLIAILCHKLLHLSVLLIPTAFFLGVRIQTMKRDQKNDPEILRQRGSLHYLGLPIILILAVFIYMLFK